MDVEGGAGCGCLEPAVETREQWVYKGPGKGSYSKVGTLQLVGYGQGDFEKERHQVSSGSRCRCACVVLGFLCVLALLLLLLSPAQRGAMDPCDQAAELEMQLKCCAEGHLRYCARPALPAQQIVVHDKYFTHVKNVPVPHTVPVPIPAPPAQVIQRKVFVHSSAFDCHRDLGEQQWSNQRQRYCCYKRNIGCKTRLDIRPHYHTITHIKQVMVPVPVPVPAPPAQVVNRVVNVPIYDPPEVIKVPMRGAPHVVHKYVHARQYVPVPEASHPKYHAIPVPVPVKDPGKVVEVPVPLPPKTLVKHKVIYRTRHVKVKRVYDCHAGLNNWKYGWSSAKQSWCCAHHDQGCHGTWKGHGLTKMVVTKVTSKVDSQKPRVETIEGVKVAVRGPIEGQTMA